MARQRTQIHLYCLCWNDARLLPFFFRHYGRWVDRFIVYDNGSTDASLALLAGDERVSVRHFDTPGDSFVAEELRLSECIWQESRGTAAWVVVIDIDEFLYHPDPRAYLDQCWRDGVTAIQATAYEMIADTFPNPDDDLPRTVTRGFREPTYDKLGIFDPNAILRTNYTPGRHKASPQGQVRFPASREMLLLHYKKLGLQYLVDRSADLSKGIGEGDLALNFGSQYMLSARRWATIFRHQRRGIAPVPGLSTLADPDLHLVADDRRLDAFETEDNRYCFVLPPGTGEVRIVSRPGASDPDLPNRSVAVSRVRLRDDLMLHDISLDDPSLAEGWLEVERIGPMNVRWTSGDAVLRLPERYRSMPMIDVELIWATTPAP